VKLLEDSNYDGPRHFDAHAYRTETPEGVWDFARGCMRTYLLLKDKARRFDEDDEIQTLRAEIAAVASEVTIGRYDKDRAAALKQQSFDRDALASRSLAYERLDQLVVDLLL